MPVPVSESASRVEESAPARSLELLKHETTVFDDLLAVAEEVVVAFEAHEKLPLERRGPYFSPHRDIGIAARAARDRARGSISAATISSPGQGAAAAAEREKSARHIDGCRGGVEAPRPQDIKPPAPSTGLRPTTSADLDATRRLLIASAREDLDLLQKSCLLTAGAEAHRLATRISQSLAMAARIGTNFCGPAVQPPAPAPAKPDSTPSTLRMAHCEMELHGDAEQQRRTINATIDALTQAFLHPHPPAPGTNLDIKA